MKSLLALLVIQVLIFYLASCFQCSSVSDPNQCRTLQGCSWNVSSSSCQGTFSPSCPTSKCYYIDSFSTAASPDGTPELPLKTLTDGFKKLATSDGTLVIVNYQENTTVDVTQSVTISTNITIMPLFEGYEYSINFNKIPVASPSYTTMITISKQLSVIGATFKNISASYPKLRIFALRVGILVFQKVEINGLSVLSGAPTLWQIVFDMTVSTTKYSSFYFLEGKVVDTTAAFTINGPSYWENVQTLNYQGLTFLSSASPLPMRFKNCSFIGGNFLFIQPYRRANITIEDSNFIGIVLKLFFVTGAQQILISNTTFENIMPPTVLETAGYFMKVILDPAEEDALYLIQDTTFRNFFTPYPLIILPMGDTEFFLIRVRMENITLNPSLNSIIYQKFFGDSPFGICLTSYGISLNIESSNFTEISEDCLGLRATKLGIKSSIFNNSMITEGDVLTEKSYKTLNKKLGITWIVSEETPGSEMIVQGNIFLENKQLSLYGGALRVTGVQETKIILTENQFLGNIAVYGGAVFIEGGYSSLSMENNIFLKNTAMNGGAIYKTSLVANSGVADPSFSTQNDIFQQNSALGNGGALYLGWESFQAQNTQFLSNSAQNGGAVYFIHLNAAGHNGLRNLIFKENSAAKYGGALKLFFNYSDLNESPDMPSTFENNLDMDKNAIHDSRPSYYQLKVYDVVTIGDVSFPDTINEINKWVENPQNTKLKATVNVSQAGVLQEINQKSGQKMSQILSLQVIDDRDQIAEYIDNEEKVKIQITSFENNISNKKSYCSPLTQTLSFSQGQIYIYNDLKIEGEPKTKATLNLKSIGSFNGFLSDASTLMDFDVGVNFLECTAGEIFNTRTRTCDPCQGNSFSFDDPYEPSARCYPCIANAFCLGRNLILPSHGFWRYNNKTATMFESRITSASKGGYDTESGRFEENGLCVAPYAGNKCDECVEGYAHFGSRGECFNCSNPLYYAISMVFVLMQLGVILALSLGYIFKKTHNIGLIKVVISFVQMVSILFELRFKVANFALDTIWGLNKLIPLGKDGLVIDCFLNLLISRNAGNHLNFMRIMVVGLVQPLLFWLVLISICKIYFNYSKKSSPLSMKKMGVFLFMIISFVLQPYIIQTSLEVLKCQNYTPDLGEANYFMQENTNTRCFTRDHIVLGVIPGLIMTLIWGFALPCVLIKTSIKDPFYTNFFCGDFKGSKKYWELVVLIRKFVIIVIVNCAFNVSTGVQGLLISPLLFLFFLLQWRISPYRDRRINSAELMSLLSSFLTMTVIFLIAYQDQSKDYVDISNLFSAIIVIFVLCFYLCALATLLKRRKEPMIFTPEVTKEGITTDTLSHVLRSFTIGRGKSDENSEKGSIIRLQKVDNGRSTSHQNKRLRIYSPRESGNFSLLSSLEMQGSEDSNLLASPRTFRKHGSITERIELSPEKEFKEKDD